MDLVAAKPSKHRRFHQWTGQHLSGAADDNNPVYKSPANAYSVQGIQAAHPGPPGPYRNGYGVASMAHLPARVPAPPQTDCAKWTSYSKMNQSVSNIMSQATEKAHATIVDLERLVLQCVGGAPNPQEPASRLLDQVLTSIDAGIFCGRENDLLAACSLPFRSDPKKKNRRETRTAKEKPSGSVDYFSKVYLYANSRMPPDLPVLRFYPATYPLLQLAAQYSRRVYEKPRGRERHSYVSSDWRHGTKAMVIKSLPVDNMNTIVFSIRGTQSFMDWAVNMQMEPVSPKGFLDDPTNCCHAGFLSVARKMVAPVAARLRTLIEEDPGRMSYSLLITGHSAGGAVASLLYLHILSSSPEVASELTHLRGCFKHIHCVTFGAPPISFRPLLLPKNPEYSRFIFFSFVNEGDPVCRAEKGYFLSLLDLFAKPPPGSCLSSLNLKPPLGSTVYWHVPPSTLSTAGRLVLLRDKTQPSNRPQAHRSRNDGAPPLPPREDVEACGITDAGLRGVVFGDPLTHFMDLYARRIDILARDSARINPKTKFLHF
ncbi:hypothetical protein N7486_009145 [Penicillium sp. IBT 16267x]|nr:hypothetical protein N7486_009145 [Penicillium sp. IBT 16267x]